MPITINPKELEYDYLENLYEKKVFETYKPKKISSRKYEEIKVSTDELTFKLIDKEQRDLVSLIHGELNTYHDVEYYEISWAFSKYPQQGYLTYLFELLIYEFNYKVLSDKCHTTPGSKEFWQKHINKSKFKVFRLDLDSNYKRNAKSFNEDDIWGTSSSKNLFLETNNLDYNNYETVEDDENSYFQNELIENIERNTENFENEFMHFENENKNTKKRTVSKDRIRLIAEKNIG